MCIGYGSGRGCSPDIHTVQALIGFTHRTWAGQTIGPEQGTFCRHQCFSGTCGVRASDMVRVSDVARSSHMTHISICSGSHRFQPLNMAQAIKLSGSHPVLASDRVQTSDGARMANTAQVLMWLRHRIRLRHRVWLGHRIMSQLSVWFRHGLCIAYDSGGRYSLQLDHGSRTVHLVVTQQH